MKKINDFPVSFCDTECPNAEDCKWGAFGVSEEEFYELQKKIPKLQEIPCIYLAFHLMIEEEQKQRRRNEVFCSEMKFRAN